MPNQRQSDENSNPDRELKLNVQNIEVKLETNKPLLPSNENEASIPKRRLSTFEKKQKIRFEKSGMKKGSLLKYFVKENPEEMHKPVVRNRASSTCNLNSGDTKTTHGDTHNRVSAPPEVIAISSGPESSVSESVSPEEFDVDSPQVSDYDEGEDVVQNEQVEANDIEFFINNLDDRELSGEDKIERWQRQNKRMLQDNERNVTNDFSDLQPPPSKAIKFEVIASDMLLQTETTPVKSQDSSTSSPPLRIVNVYTLSGNNTKNQSQEQPSMPTASSSSISSMEKAKKSVFIYKEVDNSNLASLMEKKNWRKAMDIMNKDLVNYKLPSRLHMSQFIRKAILCEDTRVSKDVQSESIKLLEKIMENYPPYNGSGRDPSVKYYKEIFEQIFDEGNNNSNELGNRLYLFLTELHKRLEVEKNALQLLILVTRLVVDQYNLFEREPGVRVHPPFFQYFLEEKESVFTYNESCLRLVDYCCNARSDEEFCIYLSWVDLISRRLGNFAACQKDYTQFIKDLARNCLEQNDLGLFILMNIPHKLFSLSVCESIFDEKLKVVKSENKRGSVVSQKDRSIYLKALSKTMLIKPAGDIVGDVVEESCKTDSTLTFKQLSVNAFQSTQRNCDNQGRGRKRNVKGETRLHILCRPGQENPISDVRKHLESYPDDVNVKDNFGNTPLHDCAKNNKGNIIVTLMELHEKKKLRNIDFLARNESLETPMHLAATYCDPQTTEIFMYFATSCGVLEQVLTTANKNGKLPFELAPSRHIQQKLTPKGYDKQSMLTHKGMTLDDESVETLESCFELKKLLAWWSQNCVNA